MPPLIVTESAYDFVPPHEGNIWPWLLSRYAIRLLRTQHGIASVEVRGAEKIESLLEQKHGLLLAPNHCRMSDALVLQHLTKATGQPFFVMASSHLFRGSGLMKWALRRLGAFSVYREGVDRQAVETAIDIMVQGKRPLVIFPEGALNQANDRLNALMEGVSFIARTAAKRVEKQNGEGNSERGVYVVPIAIRYLFKGDLDATVSPLLSDIERRLSWRTEAHSSLVDRIYKIGNALLGLKEIEFIGNPQDGSIADRLQNLIDHLLCPMEEEWIDGRNCGSVVNRVKELRKAIVPDMIQGEDGDGEEVHLAQQELDRRWRQLEDMELAQALSLFPKEYIASSPTVDRVLETVERIAENLSGEAQSHPPMTAIIQVGEPHQTSGKRDRKATADPVLSHLETQLTSMLTELSTESHPYRGGQS